MGEQRPTVLIFEDLHWADDGLLDFVDNLVDRASGVPLVVLCSARPELLVRRPGWGGGKANATTLSLSPLTDAETTRLITASLQEAVLPVEMQEALLRRAEGNPLFAEEYIRMLRDRGHLRLDGGAWRMDRGKVELPETVQGIIAARLDALTPEEKDVLQTASVVGKVFWLGSVVAIGGGSASDTEDRLHALERKELVRHDRHASLAGESEYAVRHVLVRDVAYGQIPRARRADLHVRAAQWIESLAADRSEDRSEMRAHHYLAALELIRAAGGDTGPIEGPARQALREAGARAYALSALESAIVFYRRAHELWPVDDPAYPRLLFELGSALFWTSNEGADELREAADRLLAAGDAEGAADAQSRLAWLAWRSGSRDEARSHSQRSVELIAGLPETGTTVAIRAYAWRLQFLQGEQPVARGGGAHPGLDRNARHDRGDSERQDHPHHRTWHVHRGRRGRSARARAGGGGCTAGELAHGRARLQQPGRLRHVARRPSPRRRAQSRGARGRAALHQPAMGRVGRRPQSSRSTSTAANGISCRRKLKRSPGAPAQPRWWTSRWSAPRR